MNIKNKKIVSILALVAVVGLLLVSLIRANESTENLSVTEEKVDSIAIMSKSGPPAVVIDSPAHKQQAQITTITSTATNAPKTPPASTLNITLSVEGRSYATFAPAGSNVLDAMQNLASTSDFKFTGRDYPSLGFFVDSINGKKGESGHYWILYINGTSSNTGASETHLKAGDRVEWRYQKSY